MMHHIVSTLKKAIEDWVNGPDSVQYLAVLSEVGYDHGEPNHVATRVNARVDMRKCNIDPSVPFNTSVELNGKFTDTPFTLFKLVPLDLRSDNGAVSIVFALSTRSEHAAQT